MRKHDLDQDELRQKERERGMVLGMLMFFPIGIALSITLGNPGMIGVGVAMGLPIGLAIGDHRYKQLTGKE